MGYAWEFSRSRKFVLSFREFFGLLRFYFNQKEIYEGFSGDLLRVFEGMLSRWQGGWDFLGNL